MQDFPYNYFGVLRHNGAPFAGAMLVTEDYAISTENFQWKNIPKQEISLFFGFENGQPTFITQLSNHTQFAGEDIRLLTVSSSNRRVFTQELILNQTVYFGYFFS